MRISSRIIVGTVLACTKFEPLDKFIGATSEGWTWKGNPEKRLGRPRERPSVYRVAPRCGKDGEMQTGIYEQLGEKSTT